MLSSRFRFLSNEVAGKKKQCAVRSREASRFAFWQRQHIMCFGMCVTKDRGNYIALAFRGFKEERVKAKKGKMRKQKQCKATITCSFVHLCDCVCVYVRMGVCVCVCGARWKLWASVELRPGSVRGTVTWRLVKIHMTLAHFQQLWPSCPHTHIHTNTHITWEIRKKKSWLGSMICTHIQKHIHTYKCRYT